MATMQVETQTKKGDYEMREAVELLLPKPSPQKTPSKGRATEVGATDVRMHRLNAFLISLLIFFLFPISAFCKGTLQEAVHNRNVKSNGAETVIKAVGENRKQMVINMASGNTSSKQYDHNAKTLYSENDVKAFVYQWFAGFDHQADIAFFKKHLNPGKVDMRFPDFPIKNISEFERWYDNVIADIKWNSHNISHLKVAGDEVNGFSLSLDINWKAKTYDDKNYDMNIHQDWEITVDKNRNFIIERLRAEVIDNK
ncbi:MAG: hypothetical protein WAM61_08110 [Desulfobacterales bacterium]